MIHIMRVSLSKQLWLCMGWVVFFTFPVLLQRVCAQELPQRILLRGKVIHHSDSTEIPNAHIVDLRSGKGTITAWDGSFALMVEQDDRILITALGFYNDTLLVNRSIFMIDTMVVVALKTRAYDLPVVEIHPYATFTDFKYAFLNFKDPEPGIDLNLPAIPNLEVPGEGFGVTINGPITALYDQFSKRGKEIRKYREVIASEELHRKASRVVNVETVRRYTDLHDEAEIYRFLRFCNMSDAYIVASNEYEVYQQLLACYQQYCEIEK